MILYKEFDKIEYNHQKIYNIQYINIYMTILLPPPYTTPLQMSHRSSSCHICQAWCPFSLTVVTKPAFSKDRFYEDAIQDAGTVAPHFFSNALNKFIQDFT